MQSQKLYDANYDSELERERIECKALCQEYNHLPIKETEKRSRLIKKILGKTGEKMVVLDAGGVSFGDNVFVAPNCGFHTSGHPIDFERRNRGLEYAYPIKVGNNVWFGAGVQVMPGVTIGSNVVIGAGSVVVKDIPSDSVAVGNPCKVIRPITEEDKKKCWDRT